MTSSRPPRVWCRGSAGVWQLVPHPGPKRSTGRPPGGLVRFLHRCAVHEVMCRPLEQWEIALVSEKPSTEGVS